MTEEVTNDIQTLIRAGNAALLDGDAYEARRYFRQALDQDSTNVEALIGMAAAVRPYRERKTYLQQALASDPTNADARASLEYVADKLAAGEVLAPLDAGSKRTPVVETTPIDETSGNDAEQTEPADGDHNDPNHIHIPDVTDFEIGLRCISCGKPIIDTQKAVWSPVGQLCADCARVRRPPNYQVSITTIAITATISFFTALILGLLVIMVLAPIPLFSIIISFILAPVVAELLVRALDYITKSKRGRTMQIAVSSSIALGATPWFLLLLLGGGLSFTLLIFAIFMVILASTAVARLR